MCPAVPVNPAGDTLQESVRAVATDRLRQRGKFFFRGEKIFIRGVTYGTFRPDDEGNQYGDPARVDSDFAMMVARGINAIRTYTVPPSWLLDSAHRWNLSVMVGLPWEQHITFLDDKRLCRRIVDQVRRDVQICAGHPAVFCYAVGNEIPASIVRWHGPRHVARFIEELYTAAKSEDPDGLVTYVNYPTTEYLYLPFLDFCCFNVYLETQKCLDAYLARLQTLAGDRPLLMAETGLDSRRNGEESQAGSLDWQIRSVFAAGCAGLFVFSWTDEWYRGGYDIEDWDFGLTTRDRMPKPSLMAVEKAFTDVPFSRDDDWPRISVVLCSYNGSATIDETLAHLLNLDYPDYEVIVVNDGSTDATEAIAGRYDVRLISVENGGLSRARNIGLEAATGEIVAYIDDDAYPDPHWLSYLAHTFKTTDHVAVGGPNIQPPGDGWIAECVAGAPGGPIHVLISDQEAEHIPGCNMAFRKSCLEEIGGFDHQFRVAGDDVDVCWRLLDRGWTIGFSHVATVWHHRRNSIRTYWRQQVGYGKAEAMLERKWPQKYNSLGHATWSGRVYDGPSSKVLRLRRPRIYHGSWGLAPFQRLYRPVPGLLSSLHELPEWYLFVLLLGLLSALSFVWTPMLFFVPCLAIALSIPLVQALACTRKARYPCEPRSLRARAKFRAITTFLHLLQPVARLWGRLKHGLTPWRCRGRGRIALPTRYETDVWSESWRSPEDWLKTLECGIRKQGAIVQRGGDFDSWDLKVRGGIFSSVYVKVAVEEHGGGSQLVRFKASPRFSTAALFLLLVLAGFSIWAILENQWLAVGGLGAFVVILLAWILGEASGARMSLQTALEQFDTCASQSDLASESILDKGDSQASFERQQI